MKQILRHIYLRMAEMNLYIWNFSFLGWLEVVNKNTAKLDLELASLWGWETVLIKMSLDEKTNPIAVLIVYYHLLISFFITTKLPVKNYSYNPWS